MTKKFPMLILGLIAALTLALAATSFSSSPSQGAGKVSTRDFSFISITGDDLSNLPSGESRLVRKVASGDNSTGAAPPRGTVTWILDGSGARAELTKTGTGTLILPNANNRAGVTKVGPGTLENSSNKTPALTKELTGTLILAAPVDVVYEFKNLGIFKSSQVFLPVDEKAGSNSTDIKSYVRQRRPESAMRAWPFNRLLIGPPAGIAQVEGWKPALTDKPTPGSKYVCSGNFCACSGSADCLGLISSGACSSDMNCDGSGGSTKCYCKSK